MSETTRLGALIFGMLHHLVVLNQVCSNNATGAKICPAQRVMFNIDFCKEKIKKIYLCETIWPKAQNPFSRLNPVISESYYRGNMGK